MGMVRKVLTNKLLKDVTKERVRIEEYEESLCKDCGLILFFSRVSLSKFSLETLNISWV